MWTRKHGERRLPDRCGFAFEPGDAMSKLLSAVSLFLMSCRAWAATREMEGAGAPVETVDVIYVVIFVVVFVGAIAGFIVYLWMSEKKQKPGQ
jgi:hypothetical protein